MTSHFDRIKFLDKYVAFVNVICTPPEGVYIHNHYGNTFVQNFLDSTSYEILFLFCNKTVMALVVCCLQPGLILTRLLDEMPGEEEGPY